LQEVVAKATGRRCNIAKELALTKSAVEDKAHGAANMTAVKRLQFRLRQSDAQNEATTRSFADTECITIQVEREIYGITSNEQKRFKMEFSISLIECEACWEPISIQSLRKTIQ
jgi:hypothetical protein